MYMHTLVQEMVQAHNREVCVSCGPCFVHTCMHTYIHTNSRNGEIWVSYVPRFVHTYIQTYRHTHKLTK